jgi:putative hydrolase of the HAD superfamily
MVLQYVTRCRGPRAGADLDDTLYPGDTGIGAALRRNIDEFLQAKLGVSADEAAGTRAELFRAHGSSLAGLIVRDDVSDKY